MHDLNVLILGPNSFSSTLNELKTFLKFNPLQIGSNKEIDIILFHVEVLKNKQQKKIIDASSSLKICATIKKDLSSNYDAYLELPATLKEINTVIENTAARKKFSNNSSIKIKDYLLNKNEKRLSKLSESIILTEKEVQLLELFLINKEPITKNIILSSVWNYSAEADTHTVETHIYRLRKKIHDKFSDENFIINTKDGYSL